VSRFDWSPGDVVWEGEPPPGVDDDGYEDFGSVLPEEERKNVVAAVEKLETSPGDVKAAERLRHYWAHGEGAAKVGWGTPGDFDRCVEHVGKYMRDPKGYCNLRHHEALGYYPATHAAMERGHKNEEPTLVKGYYPDASELLNMMIGLMEEVEEG
jgi:hypothetical protein